MSTDQTAVAEPMLRRLADLPSPKGLPLIGNALDIVPHLFHQKLVSKENPKFLILQIQYQNPTDIQNHK